MTSEDRLSGWKEIAGFLNRSVRSVQRWEEELNLPVRRVKTRAGQVVYASRAELEAWLLGAGLPPDDGCDQEPVSAPGGSAGVRINPTGQLSHMPPWSLSTVLVAVVAVAGLVYAGLGGPTPDYSRSYLTIVGRHIEARTPAGEVLWKYDVQRDVSQVNRELVGPVDRTSDSIADVDLNGDGMVDRLIPVRYGIGGHDPGESDGLMAFSADGRLLWSTSPSSVFTCGQATYEGPWRMSSVRVSNGDGPKRVWVSYVHHTWWPSMVFEILSDGQQQLRYFQSGWIMSLTDWKRADGHYLVAGGVLNHERTPSVALIGVDAPLTVASSTSGEFKCNLAGAPPEELTTFPMLEVATAQGLPYLMAERVMRLGESLRVELGSHALAHLGPDGDVETFGHTDVYWELHRQLSSTGILKHPAGLCVDQHAPLAFRKSTRGGPWRTTSVAPRGLFKHGDIKKAVE